MRISTFLALCVAAFAAETVDRSKPPATPPLPAFKLPAVFETQLANGLEVMLVEDARFPLVTARLAFHAGSRFDPANLPGLAEATAALLTEGTKARKARDIAEEVNSIGGELRGFAAADTLRLAGSALSEHTARLLDLMADVARNAVFPEDEIALYKQNRKQSLLEQRSQAEFLAQEKLSAVLFGPHPYARIAPPPDAIDRLDQAELVKFRDTYIVPNNGVLLLLGRLPARAGLLKSLEARFGGWERREVPAAQKVEPPAPKRSITLVDRPGSVQADVMVGRLGVRQSSPEYFPMTVGSNVLGGGTNSRLFLEIREKKGYAYAVYSEHRPYKEAAQFSTVMQVRNEVTEDALRALLAEMERMAKERVPATELSDVKNYLSGTFVLRLERQESLANQVLTAKMMGLGKEYLETYTTRIRSVEPDQIEAVAKKVIAPGDAAIVVVGDAKQIRPAVEKFGKVEVTPAK